MLRNKFWPKFSVCITLLSEKDKRFKISGFIRKYCKFLQRWGTKKLIFLYFQNFQLENRLLPGRQTRGCLQYFASNNCGNFTARTSPLSWNPAAQIPLWSLNPIHAEVFYNLFTPSGTSKTPRNFKGNTVEGPQKFKKVRRTQNTPNHIIWIVREWHSSTTTLLFSRIAIMMRSASEASLGVKGQIFQNI